MLNRLWSLVKRLFQAWTRFAEALGGVMTGILFGACYLILLAPFAALLRWLDPLRIRRKALSSESHWIERRKLILTQDMLERMG